MNKYFLVLVAFFFCFGNCKAQNFDVNLVKKINSNETNFKNEYLNGCAHAVTPLGIGIPAGIALAGFITHNNKLKQDAMYMAGGFIISSVVTQAAKKIINRQRPFATYSFIIKRADTETGLSLPSGHTSAAFCTATNVALRYKKWYFIAPAYLFATSVAWARMYQGVHYPSDVFTGALVGTGSAWVAYKIQKWMLSKQKTTAAKNIQL